MAKINCPNCGGNNITFHRERTGEVGAFTNSVVVKTPKKKKGLVNGGASLIYWMSVGWLVEPTKYVLFGGKQRGGVGFKVDESINVTVAVCQDCGKAWRVSNSMVRSMGRKQRDNKRRSTPPNDNENAPAAVRGNTSIDKRISTDARRVNTPPRSNVRVSTDGNKRFSDNTIATITICSIIGFIMLMAVIVSLFGSENTSKDIVQVSLMSDTTPDTPEPTNTTKSTETPESVGVTGIDVQISTDYKPIDKFSYTLSKEAVKLESYNGRDETLEIMASYEVDGKEYNTDLSEFQIGIGNSQVKTVILDEGIEEVRNAIFNSTDVQRVFFPSSMRVVHDNTLMYLHSDNDTVKIYYAGTQDDWLKIFKKYERTKVEDAEIGAELGEAVADKLNEMMGSGYDSSEFEYFFSASPDDAR